MYVVLLCLRLMAMCSMVIGFLFIVTQFVRNNISTHTHTHTTYLFVQKNGNNIIIIGFMLNCSVITSVRCKLQ